MKASDLVIEVRDKNFNRLGQFSEIDKVGFTAVLRYNSVGTWSATLPVGNAMAEYLRQPGAGIVITTDQGVLFSGPMTGVKTSQSTEDPYGTYEFSGVDDSVILTERLAYPTPATADLSAQTTPYDVRTGSAETVIKNYVSANIGPLAPATRKIANLSIEPTQNRGLTVSGSARFEKLQDVIKPLADLAGLGFTVEAVGNGLQFQVFEPVNRSAYIRLDLENGRLSKSEYTLAQPITTRVVVGGDGDAAARILVERTNSTATSAEEAWGRRIEVFADQRSETDPAKLQQAGDEILAKDGKPIIAVSVSPSDDQTMLYGKDWNLGDRVTCVIGDTEVVAVVTEVGLKIDSDGVRIGATVGEPKALDYETQILTRQAEQASRISNLERT